MSAAKKLEPTEAEPITTKEAASLLNVSQKTIRRWIEKGYLRAADLVPGCSLRVSRESVERILEDWKRRTTKDNADKG